MESPPPVATSRNPGRQDCKRVGRCDECQNRMSVRERLKVLALACPHRKCSVANRLISGIVWYGKDLWCDRDESNPHLSTGGQQADRARDENGTIRICGCMEARVTGESLSIPPDRDLAV